MYLGRHAPGTKGGLFFFDIGTHLFQVVYLVNKMSIGVQVRVTIEDAINIGD